MRICLVLIAALMLVWSFAIARDSSDGCGLGWEITSEKTMSATTTRATTNSVVPPTFGMTTGTIGCERHSLVKNDKAPVHYAEANYENLLTEMAVGKGESLEGLAAVMGCSDYDAFSKSLQKNYNSIVPNDSVSPQEMLRGIRGHAVCSSL